MLTFGLIFVVYGWPKLMNAAGMPARGLPVFLGYLAPFVEFFGGLFIVFGFATRYSALFLVAFVLIATLLLAPVLGRRSRPARAEEQFL